MDPILLIGGLDATVVIVAIARRLERRRRRMGSRTAEKRRLL
jgi:hypothetical protein